MNTTLTDAKARARNIARTQAHGLFLQEAARDELEDRVALVNKSFRDVAVVTDFPQVWAKKRPHSQCVPGSETLQLQTGRHDLVMHGLGLHWANDPVGQLIQCRRALRPDGLLLAASLGGQTLHELRACLGSAEIALTGGLSPRVAPMAELRDLGALLQRAGLALPVADSVSLKVQYRDMWHLMRDLRSMGEGNALAERLRRPTRRTLLENAANLYAETYPGTDGGILATYDIIVLTGWAPDTSQPQPLRPGSATARLADALRTDETPLPD